ncbi:MAG TPA: hypothetical protein VG936_17530 [Lacunisphaera sp.]|nr:hypothetical protein [Lacunisphaera sp.]
MKTLPLLGLFAILSVGVLAADFWQQLTPAERREAGLEELTPDQRAALDRFAQRYATEGARQAVAVAKTEARVMVEKEIKKQDEARLGLESPKNKGDVVSSRIAGTFKGWTGRTLFRLENGQTWVQVDGTDVYWVPARPGPDVEVQRSSIGGWKLVLVENGRWVRVRRVQ